MTLDTNQSQYGDKAGDTSTGEGDRPTYKFALIRRIPPEVPIFLFYIGMTVFLTWPVMQHISRNVYGTPSDNLGQMWLWWWIRNAASFGAKASYSPLIGYPFGQHFPTIPSQFIIDYGARLLLVFTNQVIVYNLKILTSFALSGVTMYYLVRYTTRNKGVAFFAGFAYLVSAYHAVHASFFVDLAQTQWMPLYILMLLFFLKKPSFRNAVFLWASAILVAETSVHYGFFMAVFTASFLLGRFAYKRVRARRLLKNGVTCARDPVVINKNTLALALLVLFATIVVVIPLFYGDTLQSKPGNWPTRQPPGGIRDLDSAKAGSATPESYVFPETENFFLGWITRKLSPGSAYGFSNSLYLGLSIIALALLTVVQVLRRKRKTEDESDEPGGLEQRSSSQANQAHRLTFSLEDRPIIWGLIIAAIAAFVLSMPPYCHIGSIKVPLPSITLRFIVPWLRWYMRMGVVVIICFILLASYGLSWLLEGTRRVRRVAVLLCVTVFLFLEMTVVPPFKYFTLSERLPRVFERFAALNASGGLVIYPAFDQGYFASQQYLYYQESFKKPMLNGAHDNSDGEALRRTVYNPFNPATPGILKRFNIEHVLYLDKMFEKYWGTEKGAIEVGFLPPGLQLEDKAIGKGYYESGYIFKVTAPGADLVPIYQGDITIPLIDEGRVTVRLLEREGLVRIVNYAGRDVRANILLPVANLAFNHFLVVSANGSVVWKGKLTGDESRVIDTGELTVPSEGLELFLSVAGTSINVRPEEANVLGARTATLKLGDVIIRPQ